MAYVKHYTPYDSRYYILTDADNSTFSILDRHIKYASYASFIHKIYVSLHGLQHAVMIQRQELCITAVLESKKKKTRYGEKQGLVL